MAKQQTPQKSQKQLWAEEGRSFVVDDTTYRMEKSMTRRGGFFLTEMPVDKYFATVKSINKQGFVIDKYVMNRMVVIRVKWSECQFLNQPEAAQEPTP